MSTWLLSDRNILLHGVSYQTRITNQLRRLGGSCDWDRVAFTMNPVGVI
jgi:valyl-tRNA synthetase